MGYMINSKNGLKPMTYILGAHCLDGVVLVADRKVTLDSGADQTFEDKLFYVANSIVVGSSGVSGLFEKFRERLGMQINLPNWEKTILNLTSHIETITRELNEQYREVLHGEAFDVLLGVKTTGGAVLEYVYPIGFAEGVRKYKAIGHGEPYGSFFLKKWWKPTMTMKDAIELGFFIIKYIQEFQLDNTVGVGDGYPQAWVMPNNPPPDISKEQIQSFLPHPMSDQQLKPIADKVSSRIAQIKQMSWEEQPPKLI